MINTLINSLKIDITYSVNSFFYNLSKLPIFNDLITEDIYSSKILKILMTLFIFIKNILKAIFGKAIYFLIIFVISKEISFENANKVFINIYFLLTILGMFINNRTLLPSKRKYISIILFNQDGNKFFKSELITNLIKNFILNTFFLSLIIFPSNINNIYILLLSLLSLNARIIGETLNIIYYKKKDYFWYTNKILYSIVIFTFILLLTMPIINIILPINAIGIISGLLIIFGLISINYLIKAKDYKLLYKNICMKTKLVSQDESRAYQYQQRVEVKEKDLLIDEKILQKKKKYDLFNTIFFNRHKEILLTSAKKYMFVAIIVYIVLILLSIKYEQSKELISVVLQYKLSFFIILMYFMNRGEVLTKAMFYNCDHVMLTYNFYREPKVILSLFKKRLITIVKVNLLPALAIGIGNVILLVITSNSYTILSLVTTFVYIISLSIFFSVHNIVMYYLLQPYNENMHMKKYSYSLVSLLTYIICFNLQDIVLSSNILTIYTIIFSAIYVVVALILVYKLSPKTFKLN